MLSYQSMTHLMKVLKRDIIALNLNLQNALERDAPKSILDEIEQNLDNNEILLREILNMLREVERIQQTAPPSTQLTD
jgi:hypothetical protein